MEPEVIQIIHIGPLTRAYLAAVRAGQISRAAAESQVADGAAYILRHGIQGTTADVLRVMAALCEAVAELKDESKDAKPCASTD